MSDQDRLAMLLRLLAHLRKHGVDYVLTSVRDEAVMVEISTPGRRWEIEVMSSGWTETLQIEQYVSDGNISGPEALGELFSQLEIPAMVNGGEPEAVRPEGPISSP